MLIVRLSRVSSKRTGSYSHAFSLAAESLYRDTVGVNQYLLVAQRSLGLVGSARTPLAPDWVGSGNH